VTMVKSSVGTGVLALPYAFARGGLLSTSLTLVLLAAWNEFCGLRLIACVGLLSPEERRRYERESPLEALARAALGSRGATAVEGIFLTLVFGVTTSYLVAAHDTVNLGRRGLFVAAALSLPLTCVSDVGKLAPAAVLGLVALGACFAITVFYCLVQKTRGDGSPRLYSGTPRAWASGFGVLSFCFGLVPIVPQFANSMREPRDFPVAQRTSLAATVVIYLCLGILVACLDPNVPGNVLYELPSTTAALAARCTVGLVCVASAPLPVVAGADIVEKRFKSFSPLKSSSSSSKSTKNYSKNSTSSSTTFLATDSEAQAEAGGAFAAEGRNSLLHFFFGFLVRASILFGAAFVAYFVPEFAVVVSVVGAATVSFLSFVLPPLIHLRLLRRRSESFLETTTSPVAAKDDAKVRRSAVIVDLVAVVLGAVVVLFATSLVTADAVASFRRGGAKATSIQEDSEQRQISS